jgi:energy-coupling factor transporter ATP-binding protein EcfA2
VSELVFEHVWSDPLKDVSLRASSGLHVLLGDEADGSGAFVELCAGVRAPRRGRVALDAERPSASPRCRRRIASLLPEEPPLAGAGDVRRWLAELALLRGVPPEAVLEGCSVDAERPVRSLAGAERRELACRLALAQRDAALVVLHDPLSACRAGQRDRVLGRIAELGRAALVLITTPSIADARALGGSCQRLDRGLIELAVEGATARGPWHGVAGACLTLEADAPRDLVAALAREPDVRELRYDEPSGRVLLRADDLERLAHAVARAIVSAGADIRALRAGADDLDVLRAAASAMDDAAGAAHRAARARGRTATSATPALAPPNPSAERSSTGTAAAGTAAVGATPDAPGSTPGGSA